jgi:hypothetical protein
VMGGAFLLNEHDTAASAGEIQSHHGASRTAPDNEVIGVSGCHGFFLRATQRRAGLQA